MNSRALIEKIGWTEWLSKTNFSFLTGASHPVDMITRAGECGYNGLAISDFDGVYGLARATTEHKKSAQNYKLIYGAELKLGYTPETNLMLWDSVVAVVRSKRGYKNLNRILTYAHRDSKKETKLSLDDLRDFDLEDLVFLQPMRGRIRGKNFHESYLKRKALFKYYYLCASRHLHPGEDHFLKKQIDLATELDLPLLYSQDAFFHLPKQKPMSDLLNAIRTNQSIDKASGHFFPNAERHFHKLNELHKIYSPLPGFEKSLYLSETLNQSIDFSFSELKYKYPREMIPENISSQDYLELLSWEGAKKRFGEHLSERIRQSIYRELKLIEELGFADYFLTVWDIVRFARSQEILCQGRGSAANSVVCYVLEITAVNPNHFDLLFERFMSKERGDPPDIDVDFEHERREEVIQYIYKRYGRKRAAMVANVITFKKKGAMRAVGKAFGFTEDLLKTASDLQRTLAFRGKTTTDIIDTVEEESSYIKSIEEQEKTQPSENSHRFKLWRELSTSLIGFPRHLGIHSGGFIIAESELDELVAQEPASMPGRSVIQWSKEDIESLGFFKIDVLALGMLTAVRKSFSYIKEAYGRELDLYNIPVEDSATYSMIQKADTVGVFQIESRAQMSMLPRLKPKTFYDLVIEIAIIRPGPIQGGIIHPFLRRRQGLEPIVFPSERLRPILSKTLGVTIFQEQAMRIAIEVGDFTPGEANELRKNIGAWNLPNHQQSLGPMLEKFERGMRTNKIPEKFIGSLLQQMKGFAEYGFPESHAISFAYIAYASSFLKCHYPAAFFTAVLNSQPMGFYSPHALLGAAKRDGVSILDIHINKSATEHRLERINDKEPGLFGIRLGLNLIRGLSKKAAARIISTRNTGGDFLNFEDFLSRAALYRDELTALAASDCFKIFGYSRKQAIWLAEALPIKPLIEQSEKDISWAPEDKLEQVEKDFKAFRTSLADHPAGLVKTSYWPYELDKTRVVSSEFFSKVIKNQVIYIFGMLLVKQAPPSAKGMVFLTLEDEYGFINLAITPQVYARYGPLIENQSFICAEAKMQKHDESHSLLVKRVFEAKTNDNITELPIKPDLNTNEQAQKKTKTISETKRWIAKQSAHFKEIRQMSASKSYR